MKAYLAIACGTVFLSVLVSFIIPNGKMGKTVTVMFRFVCITVLISPITKLFGFSDTAEIDYTDYDYICRIYAESQSDALEELLYTEYDAVTECSVTIIYKDGSFCEDSVEVCLFYGNEQTTEKIYEYLQLNGYINITVYDKT